MSAQAGSRLLHTAFENSSGERLSAGSRITLGIINFYRSYLSRFKGFSCANGAMGHQTCSTMGLHLFQNHPLSEAYNLQRKYFRQCGEMAKIFNIAVGNYAETAAAQIQEQFGKSPEEAEELVSTAIAYDKKRQKRSPGGSGRKDGCAPYACDPVPFACLSHNMRDANPCDLDIGPCDAGPGDCSP